MATVKQSVMGRLAKDKDAVDRTPTGMGPNAECSLSVEI